MPNTLEGDQKQLPRYPLASVGNALRLLLMFRTNEQVRLSDVSRELDVANSTAHRLLAMLAYHDLVQQIGTSRVYAAGPALIEVGLATVADLDIQARARPFLEELAARFDEAVHLVALERGEVHYLDAVESTQTVRAVTRVGSRLPAHATSAGLALLAELPAPELDVLYQPTIARKRLDTALTEIRTRGYAIGGGEVISVAAVIRDRSPRAVAAINVAAPAQRMPTPRRHQLAKALIDATTRLATGLPS
ncbi:IclR family transcriptional regulator [Acrocarpospora corrugata]|uniref:IclR family transcriptional regulator n=1 Tax=Acrocarpospora corrugata TaxID=35763 RepID=A0A5M3W154_9ACTN|nr:IclR family transcriptional regulator [Acrocarpospora corrugata]GES02755.1 IclR family transcriptional regulator [Acrocarpospora corrugata]